MSDDQQAAAEAAAAQPSSQELWFASIQDEDLRGWIANKQYESPEVAMRSAREAEKFVGAPKDRLLIKPGDNASEEEVAAFRAGLGVPESVDKYETVVPEALQDDVFHALREKAFEAGVPNAAWKELQSAVVKHAEGMAEEMEAAKNQAIDSLQPEQRTAIMGMLDKVLADKIQDLPPDQAAAAKEAEIDGLLNGEPGAVLGFMARLAELSGSGPMVEGQNASDFGAATIEQVQAQIDELNSDASFVDKVLAGDQAANKKMDQLLGRLGDLKARQRQGGAPAGRASAWS
ncbi:MAG: hypothetical protein AAFR28_06340 [Pseudomonadota bacterium]